MKTDAKEDTGSGKRSTQGFADKLYLAGKVRWAGWMEEKTALLSRRQLYLLLFLFVTSMGACCLFQLYRGMTGGHTIDITSGRIHAVITEGRPVEANTNLLSREYQKIKDFNKYMDSLANTAAGRKVRDSILDARPGLLDSIVSLEAYYRYKLNK